MNAPRHLGHRVRILSQAIRQAIDRKLCDLDLTGQQSFIIRYLSERQGEVVYPKDIERRFNLTHPTVSGLLSRLEQKGFLELKTDPSDRRSRQIIISGKGLACHERMHAVITENESRIVQGFTQEEKTLFTQFLQRAIENVCPVPCEKEDTSSVSPAGCHLPQRGRQNEKEETKT